MSNATYDIVTPAWSAYAANILDNLRTIDMEWYNWADCPKTVFLDGGNWCLQITACVSS